MDEVEETKRTVLVDCARAADLALHDAEPGRTPLPWCRPLASPSSRGQWRSGESASIAVNMRHVTLSTPPAWALLACYHAATADAVRYGQREVAPFAERQLRTSGRYDLPVHREAQTAA
jgi:hypothetical protein